MMNKRRINQTPITVSIFLTLIIFFNGCEDQASYDPPDENRFVKINLVSELDEPMELCILPNGNILFIERKGTLKQFLRVENKTVEIGKLNVFHGLEDGLLGLAIDPDFEKNSFIYLFYSPAGQKPIQRVSRFTLTDTVFDIASERILLEIPTQREECCHSAGSLTFGPDETLYIAVGDNTNPHNPGYYNSIDERKGREYWDAQRTAANTNDLRGKILRIKPERDGTYSIPKGNLFSKDGKNGRPEIYAMGCRNPYRITVDQKTGYLYWGDVGQNTEDNPARGPISFDEFHQAKKPGFFGWPYFAGDNQPYADFDFATEKIGAFFDPLHPRNDSPNNTGTKDLPPATGAFIWYSYDSSKLFQNLGTGGKSPIIGPVYHSSSKKVSWVENPRKFPAYYNNKLFIAEWMRDWINVVSMDENGNLTSIERFMPSTKFDHPIDLEFGPDGALYILEYGTFWFAQNKNARLARIDFNEGNRNPVARINADRIAGAHPLTVNFSSEASYDYDAGDSLTYIWTFDSSGKTMSGKRVAYTFKNPGVYTAKLRAKDTNGAESSQEITIQVGNEPAVIGLETPGNKTFYWPGVPVRFNVTVNDQEDGSLQDGSISPDSVEVVLYYSQYKTHTNENNELIKNIGGLELINQSDCKACHHEDATSVGPSYKKIATRYKKDTTARNALADKIIKGGSGTWGEAAMSAHPQLQSDEAIEMVNYILSLSGDNQKKLNSKGAFPTSKDATGEYSLQVRYNDKGGVAIGPQVAVKSFRFRNPVIRAVDCDVDENISKFNNEIVKFASSGAYIGFYDLDLSGIRKVIFNSAAKIPIEIEIRLDSINGEVIGKTIVEPSGSTQSVDASKKSIGTETKPVTIKQVNGIHSLYFVHKDIGENVTSIWNSFDLFYIKVLQ